MKNLSNNNMLEFVKKTWLLNRAIVSEDYEKTVDILSTYIDIKKIKIKSGTQCFDWEIPQKWIIKDAWIKDGEGKKIVDWKNHPLHVQIGSEGVDKFVSKKELMEHLQYSSQFPNCIPYKYLYYKSKWGFCCTKKVFDGLKGGKFHVYINAHFEKGDLIVAEHQIKGTSSKSIVLMSHLDHPGQVQDGISGCSLLLSLAQKLQNIKPYYTLRFLFLPERIGSIAYLSQYQKIRKSIIAGIFAEMISVPSLNLVLQHSKFEKHMIDRIAKFVLQTKVKKFRESPCFEHVLNDDAFYNAPGIDIPCISISRSEKLTETNPCHHKFYHTSGDDINFWDQKNADESFEVFFKIIQIISDDKLIIRKYDGVPFLTKHNLWKDDFKSIDYSDKILNHLENNSTIFSIAESQNIPFEFVQDFILKLEKASLVELQPTEILWK